MRDSNVNFNFLHKTCTLVVLLCCLHIFVTVVYYVRSMDFTQQFVQSQQQSQQVQRKLEEHAESTEEGKPSSTLVSNSTVHEKELEKCPETSPLLGMKAF